MVNLKMQINITMFFGALALLAGIFAHLALTDIYHAEGDLSLEWNVLRLCAVIFATFVISAMLVMRKLRRTL
jgi:hypothetical protein